MSHTTALHRDRSGSTERRANTFRSRSHGQGPAPLLSGRVIEIASLLLIAVLLFAGAIATRHPSSTLPAMTHVKVRSGDSLWNLAETHPVYGLTTQELVTMLSDVNNLEGAVVNPGDTVLLPCGESSPRLATR